VPEIGSRLPKLRLWVTSGEAITAGLARRFGAQFPSATLLNLYGSSEVAADVTWHVVDSGGSLDRGLIGRPIAHSQIYILNRDLRPVPIGAPGEIYGGGDALALGYLNNQELTAQKFVRVSFVDEPAVRLYKTGDLARFLRDGSVDFCGRVDSQVKIRGIRIELGEVESVLRTHAAVAAAVIAVHGDVGDECLIGYVVPKGSPPDPQALRDFARTKLPASMVPAAFVVLDRLPLLPNGKVDRGALPSPGDRRPLTSFTAPRTPLERDLAVMWSEILGAPQIGVDDNFFD